jgi:hypothetical protein
MIRSTSKSKRAKPSANRSRFKIVMATVAGNLVFKVRGDRLKLTKGSKKLITGLRDAVLGTPRAAALLIRELPKIRASPQYKKLIESTCLFGSLDDPNDPPTARMVTHWQALLHLIEAQDDLIHRAMCDPSPFHKNDADLGECKTYLAALKYIKKHAEAKLIMPERMLKLVEGRLHADQVIEGKSAFQSLFENAPLEWDEQGQRYVGSPVVVAIFNTLKHE